MIDPKFLFDNQLIAALENLIKSAKKELILVSPYIDLDARIVTALKEKKELKDFKLLVLFGKNDKDFLKSIKPESLRFLMDFPNVEIRHEERLHAKFYRNEFECIFSSINLYNFSLYNNIEVGIHYQFDYKGFIGKAIGSVETAIVETADKVKENVFGSNMDVDPIEQFDKIILNADRLYKTEPVITKADGWLKGTFGVTQLSGKDVIEDKISSKLNNPEVSIGKIGYVKAKEETSVSTESSNTSLLSATAIAKEIGISGKAVKDAMEKAGYLEGDKITNLGKSKGIQNLKGRYGDYIGFPSAILSDIKALTSK